MKSLIKRLRLLSWFIQAYVQKHGKLVAIGFIIGFLIFVGMVKLSPFLLSTSVGIKTKRIAVIGSYTPSNLPLDIQNLLSLGLTSLNPSGEATSSLAEKWEIRDEGKTYIFTLKKGLFWHDGTKFTASDVNYNLKDVQIEPISDDVLKISLKEAFSPLPTVLARPIFKSGLVGIGPYKVKSLKLKADKLDSVTLSPIQNLQPFLEYKFYPNENSAILAFKLGRVDVLEKISQINGLSSWPNVSVSSETFSNYNTILFYNMRHPLLQRRTIRQALSYAIPDFPEEKSSGPLNPLSWAYNPDTKIFSQNIGQAKLLINKEGLATVSAELTLSTFSSFLSYAQEIASNWEKLGIKTNVKVESTLPSDFDALLVSQEIPADPDQYHLWHSTQHTNITGLSNLKIDKLLEDGRRIVDKENRFKIYQDFQRYLAEEIPAVFLYHPKLYKIERK